MLTEFILYLESQIGEPYLWGGQHTKLTPYNYIEVITKKEKTEENRENAIAYCKKKFDEGATVLYAYDCSGLGMYWLENVKHIFKTDMTANGMMAQCEIVTEPKKGYWLFRLNDGRATHIGYMVSDTEVVHAAGRKLGVVKVPYQKSFWHRIGKPKCFDFDPEPKTHLYIRVKGVIKKDGKPQKSVNVRSGNGTQYPVVGVAHSTDCFPCYGQADASPYWYEIDYNGQRAYITSNSRYTEEIYKC